MGLLYTTREYQLLSRLITSRCGPIASYKQAKHYMRLPLRPTLWLPATTRLRYARERASTHAHAMHTHPWPWAMTRDETPCVCECMGGRGEPASTSEPNLSPHMATQARLINAPRRRPSPSAQEREHTHTQMHASVPLSHRSTLPPFTSQPPFKWSPPSNSSTPYSSSSYPPSPHDCTNTITYLPPPI